MAADGREAELVDALAPLGERLVFAVDALGFQVMAALTAGEGA